MSMPLAIDRVIWTTADLDFLPEDGSRYELCNGELTVTRSPHWRHQTASLKIGMVLQLWSEETGLGEAAVTPGLVFSELDAVIPDVVWASHDRLATMLDEAGHLRAAPELVVEVLSPGERNEQRDRQVKLKLYSSYGVLEYWIVDRQTKGIEVYRREAGAVLLTRAATFYANDTLTSPLLPGFSVAVDRLF